MNKVASGDLPVRRAHNVGLHRVPKPVEASALCWRQACVNLLCKAFEEYLTEAKNGSQGILSVAYCHRAGKGMIRKPREGLAYHAPCSNLIL